MLDLRLALVPPTRVMLPTLGRDAETGVTGVPLWAALLAIVWLACVVFKTVAALGFIAGFLLLSNRGVRNPIWLFLAYAFLRSDPLEGLLWLAGIAVCMLAWRLLQASAGEARAEHPGG